MRVQHLSQFADVALADGGLGNCEADHRGKVAAEEPADESVHSCGHDVLSADEGAVPELTTLSSMRENALALQPMEHGADSAASQTGTVFEGLVDFVRGGLAAFPDHTHDGELLVGEVVGALHLYRCKRSPGIVST